MMVVINFLIAIATFVILYLLERLFSLWLRKKPFWPLLSWSLLVDAIAYTVLFFLLIGIIHIVFKKVDVIGLIGLDLAIYFLIQIVNPSKIYFALKNKYNVQNELNKEL